MRRWATHGQVQPVDDHRSRLLLDGDSIHTLAGILAELDADFVVEALGLRRHLREVAARLGRATGAPVRRVRGCRRAGDRRAVSAPVP